MTKARKFWVILPVGIAAVALVAFIAGHVVGYLWNWLMPGLFGLPRVTFWQALGLLALCRILFGGTGRGGGGRRRDMSPEERQRYRQRLRERFGFGNPPPAKNQEQVVE